MQVSCQLGLQGSVDWRQGRTHGATKLGEAGGKAPLLHAVRCRSRPVQPIFAFCFLRADGKCEMTANLVPAEPHHRLPRRAAAAVAVEARGSEECPQLQSAYIFRGRDIVISRAQRLAVRVWACNRQCKSGRARRGGGGSGGGAQLTQGCRTGAKLPCRRLWVAALLQQHACVGTGCDQSEEEGRAETHHAASDWRSMGALWASLSPARKHIRGGSCGFACLKAPRSLHGNAAAVARLAPLRFSLRPWQGQGCYKDLGLGTAGWHSSDKTRGWHWPTMKCLKVWEEADTEQARGNRSGDRQQQQSGSSKRDS